MPRVGVQTYLSCGLNRVNGADLNLANLNLANLAGADLTDANLALVANLTGALWSATTRWPESIAAEVVARSEEVHPGVWQVVGSGSASADIDTPRVPM